MKKIKKLVLRKSTVANLSNSDMVSVKGGATFDPIRCLSFDRYLDVSDCCPPEPPTRDGCPPTQYIGHTAPPRCCNYGCCETIGC